MPASDPVSEHFGAGGMRRFSVAALHGAPLPDEAARTLRETGVPVVVAPYFHASDAGAAVRLDAHASHRRLPAPPRELQGWVRLGGDRGAELCVRPDGAVQAVFLSEVVPDMFVNASVDLLNRCLAALDEALPRIAAADGTVEAVAVFRELNGGLREVDPAAFAERESWWPRVLDDVRHTLNFPFSAAFEFTADNGQKEIVTDRTGPGRLHPEERLWQRLSSSGVPPERVGRVYCELQPCLMPGHYCAIWMQELFPDAEFTHSFDYGQTADSREEGLKRLILHAAEQARGRR